MAQLRHLSVDARLSGPRHAGIGRYIAEILSHLLKKETVLLGGKKYPLQWHLWLQTEDDGQWLPSPLPENVQLHKTNIRHYSLAEQWQWPRQLQTVPTDLLWVPHFNVPLQCPVPWVVTIHDLLWHQERDARATTLPAWKHFLKHLGYRAVTSHAIKEAEAILVPTQTVAAEVQQRFGADLPVFVTSEGVAETFLEAPLPQKQTQSPPKILVIGSLYPHKNINVVLRALQLLPEFRLVIASTRSVFFEQMWEEAKRFGVADRVECPGYISDSQLRQRAGEFVALVQPSTSEGFGLTGLEAMALGIPVIANTLPVFDEVYGNCARRFAAHDPHALARELRSLYDNPPTPQTLQKAQEHARQFTWKRAADKTWHALQAAWEGQDGRE